MAKCIDCMWCYLDTPMSRWDCKKGHIPVVYEDDDTPLFTEEIDCEDFLNAGVDENDPGKPENREVL